MTEAMMPVTVEQCDRDAAAPFHSALDGWFLGKVWMGKLLTEAFARHRLNTRATPTKPAGLAGEPVAYRWRYLYPNKPSHWVVRQSPIYSHPPTPHFVGIEAEPLFIANASQPDRVVDVLGEAADMLGRYAEFVKTVHADDLELHPYQPAIEELAERCALLSTLDAKDQSHD